MRRRSRSRATYTPGVPALLVANGTNFPTRWRAAPPPPSSASRSCSPTRCRSPGATRNEIIRLRPFHIYVLGGGGSVSLPSRVSSNARRNAWRADAADPSAAPEPVRHRGRGVDRVLRPGVATAFIATGLNFPMPWPVHRHRRHSVRCYSSSRTSRGDVTRADEAAAADRGARRQGSVSAGVATALDAFTTGPVTRLAGQTNRYQTAAAISQFAFPTSEVLSLRMAQTSRTPWPGDRPGRLRRAGAADDPDQRSTGDAAGAPASPAIAHFHPRRYVVRVADGRQPDQRAVPVARGAIGPRVASASSWTDGSAEGRASGVRAEPPEAWEDHPWGGESVAKVGKKVFVFFGDDAPERERRFTVKLTESGDEAGAMPWTQDPGRLQAAAAG